MCHFFGTFRVICWHTCHFIWWHTLSFDMVPHLFPASSHFTGCGGREDCDGSQERVWLAWVVLGSSLSHRRLQSLWIRHQHQGTELWICCVFNVKCVSVQADQSKQTKFFTQIKLVIVVESSNVTLRDNEIRAMFRKLHNAYMDMISSPFYTPGECHECPSFPINLRGFLRSPYCFIRPFIVCSSFISQGKPLRQNRLNEWSPPCYKLRRNENDFDLDFVL